MTISAAHPGQRSAPHTRFGYIDAAKGLAILLVVLGHVVAFRDPPPGAEWYFWFKTTIYLFHMPLFVFLSGIAYGFGFKVPGSAAAYWADLHKRVRRLLGGYLLLGALIFVGKLTFQRFAHVDNPVGGWSFLVDLLVRPSKSYTAFLWYVYSLSILYAVVPLLCKASGGRLWPLLLLACVLPFLPAGTLLSWDKLQEFSLFFVLGMIAARHHARFERLLALAWIPFGLLFAVLVPTLWSHKPALRLDACLAVIAVMGLMHHPALADGRWLKTLGVYTLSIYLFNTIFVGLARVAFVNTIGWDGPKFIVAFVVLTAAGVLVPIFLKRTVFPRIRWLDRIT